MEGKAVVVDLTGLSLSRSSIIRTQLRHTTLRRLLYLRESTHQCRLASGTVKLEFMTHVVVQDDIVDERKVLRV